VGIFVPVLPALRLGTARLVPGVTAGLVSWSCLDCLTLAQEDPERQTAQETQRAAPCATRDQQAGKPIKRRSIHAKAPHDPSNDVATIWLF
jgi:hypothetical protein